MPFVLATWLVASLSGCSGLISPTYTTEPPHQDSAWSSPILLGRFQIQGVVPVGAVLKYLEGKEVLDRYPVGQVPDRQIKSSGQLLIREVIIEVERIAGWVYDPETKAFYVSSATHSIDEPDTFGRVIGENPAGRVPRSIVSVGVRFTRVSAGVSLESVGGGGTASEFFGALPDGVQGHWESTSERSFFQTITDGLGVQSQTKSTRVPISAGIIIDALAARLPGGFFRIDGTLEVSSFSGSNGTDKSQVRIPLQLDAVRHRWIKTTVFLGGDASARLIFRQFGLSVNSTGEAVQVWVKVD